MPELPEVETTRRHLEPAVVGQRISRVEVRRDRMVRRHENPDDFGGRLRGRRVQAIDRIGKFILGRLEGEITWVIHLGMSGRIQVAASNQPYAPHSNVVVGLENRLEIRFVDPRTFGFTAAYTPDELARSSISRLGRDALDDLPGVAALARALGSRTAPIKALLLDQTIMAGLGNIYADEVLFRARLAPGRRGGSLSRDEVAALRQAIRPVLRAGLAAGGTSLGDMAYLLPDGRSGEFMMSLAVYGRAGERCRRCPGTVTSAVIRGRTAHWCPRCQG